MGSDTKIVTDASFETQVLSADGLVLVDFWAPWCGPCRMLTPVMESLASDPGGTITVAKVNVDESPQTAQRYGISSIPTVLLFRAGEVVKKLVGVQAKANYLMAIKELSQAAV